VALGMFQVDYHPIIVLFDTRATHFFVTTTWVEAHNNLVESMLSPMRISSVGVKFKQIKYVQM
jgi:hypothetical protein